MASGNDSDVKGSDTASGTQFRSIVKAKKKMPLPDQGEMELMRNVGKTTYTLKGFFEELFIDLYGFVRIGGVGMLDWRDSGMAMWLVFIHIFTFLASFIYFMYTLTLTDMSRQYLSIEGNSTERSCQMVPLQLTTTVEGDIHGNWATTTAFMQNLSIYQMSMTGTQITNVEYKGIFEKFKSQIKQLSARSSGRDAGTTASHPLHFLPVLG